MTPIIGLLHATNPIVYLSIGVGILAGIVLVVSIVKHRSTSKGGKTMADLAEDPALSRTHVASVAPTPPPPLPLAAPPLAPPPLEGTRPANPWSALEPAVELRAPGPGVLGRLRRRPLAEPQIRRPSLKAIGEEPRPTTSNSEKRSATARAKSTSRSADGSAKKRSTPARAPAGKASAGKASAGKSSAGKSRAGKPATRASAPGSRVRHTQAADAQRQSRRTGSTPVKRTAPG